MEEDQEELYRQYLIKEMKNFNHNVLTQGFIRGIKPSIAFEILHEVVNTCAVAIRETINETACKPQ